MSACASADTLAALRTSWGDCIMQRVLHMDDGKTDPVSLAYGISPACAPQYQQLTEAMVSQNVTAAGRANMRVEMREGELKLITAAILTARSKRQAAR